MSARRRVRVNPLNLLALLWPQSELAGLAPAIRTEADWLWIDAIAAQHRMRALLHRRATADAPETLRLRWATAYRRSALRALNQRAELLRIGKALARTGLEGVALKGAGLAWSGMIDPAVRPMRDLDLLIAPEIAHKTYAALGITETPDGMTASLKHLPGHDMPSGVHVELHTKLIDCFTPEAAAREERFRHAATARARALPGAAQGSGGRPAIRVFAPGDALLHFIVHAVLDHQFNNGPLLLLDLAALINGGEIDWGLFWHEAEQLGARRASQLALRLAQAWQPELEVDWRGASPDAIGPELLVAASMMMGVDMTRGSRLGWAGALASVRGRERAARLFGMLARRWRKGERPESDVGPSGSDLAHRIVTVAGTAAAYAGELTRPSARLHMAQSLSVARWLRQG